MWYKKSAVRHLVLSQSTRVTDRRIDGQTDRRTDRQNYDSQDRPRICSRGKNTATATTAMFTRLYIFEYKFTKMEDGYAVI